MHPDPQGTRIASDTDTSLAFEVTSLTFIAAQVGHARQVFGDSPNRLEVVEVLAEHTDDLGYGKWKLLTMEAHTISEFAALLDRPGTEKGFKDAREIACLLDQGVDAATATTILVAATAGSTDDLRGHVTDVFTLLGPHAGLNMERRRLLGPMRRAWDDAIVAAATPAERARPPLA